MAFVYYVIADFRSSQYGLFRGTVSPWAYLLAFFPVIAILITGHIIASRRARAEKGKQSSVSNLDTEERKER